MFLELILPIKVETNKQNQHKFLKLNEVLYTYTTTN